MLPSLPLSLLLPGTHSHSYKLSIFVVQRTKCSTFIASILVYVRMRKALKEREREGTKERVEKSVLRLVKISEHNVGVCGVGRSIRPHNRTHGDDGGGGLLRTHFQMHFSLSLSLPFSLSLSFSFSLSFVRRTWTNVTPERAQLDAESLHKVMEAIYRLGIYFGNAWTESTTK